MCSTTDAEYETARPLRIAKTLRREKLITRRLIRRERVAVADSLTQIGGALVLAAILGSCTGADIENGALGAAKSWCRLHSPQYCSVNDESPSAR
jgi:hypothetical protein